MPSLGSLICGNSSVGCTANSTLDNLQQSIDRFGDRAIRYFKSAFDEEAQSFGAFCTRVVLENACAALVGRLDPFRLLYLTEFQSQGGYVYGKPAKSGFRWGGDVLTETSPVKDLWNTDHDVSKISRALFSPHVDHVFWRPAVESAIDFISMQGDHGFHDLQALDPETFTDLVKGRFSTLYSTLSKGVHWDFFASSVIIDEDTVKESIRDCMTWMSSMGLISHFVPTVFRSLSPEAAFDEFRRFRESLT